LTTHGKEPSQSHAKSYNGLELPKNGQPIEYRDGKFEVPDHPIIPFIEGDGTGRDIWKASQRVFDAAVEKPTAANAPSNGLKSLLARKPFDSSRPGCPTTRLPQPAI